MNKTDFPCGFTRCPIYHLLKVFFANVVHVIEHSVGGSFVRFVTFVILLPSGWLLFLLTH